MPAPARLVTLIDPFVKGWPEHAFVGHSAAEGTGAFSFAEIAAGRFDTDVHFTAYSSSVVARHTTGSLYARGPDCPQIQMELAVFDVDAPGHQASEEWWQAQRAIVKGLDTYVYQTRGGYRIVLELEEPFPIRDENDAARWTALYQAWCEYLHTEYGIVADLRCKEWQRLYRAPHATRDGVMLDLDVLGDPGSLSCWTTDYAGVVPATDSAPAPAPAPAPTQAVAVRHAAAAAALSAAWPTSGRHGAQLALAGALCHDGWAEGDALEFLCSVCSRAGNEDRPKREKTVRATYKAHGEGRPTQGWTSLGGYVDPVVLEGVRSTLNKHADGARELLALVTAAGADAAGTARVEGPSDFTARIKRGPDWAEPYVRAPYLLDGLIPIETVATFFAEGGSVKSWSVFALAISVATGTPWLGSYPVTKGKVLILDYEDGWAEFRRRKGILLGECSQEPTPAGPTPARGAADPTPARGAADPTPARGAADLDNLEYLYCGPNIADLSLWLWLGTQDYTLVVIDALSSAMPGTADENDQRFSEGLKAAGRYVAATGRNVVGIHHANKAGGMRGTSAVRDQSDVVFQFVPVSETDTAKRMRMECNKPGPQKKPLPVNIELNDGGLFLFTDEVQDVSRNAVTPVDIRASILLALESNGGMKRMALQSLLKKRKKDLLTALKDLQETGEMLCIDHVYDLDSDEYREHRVLETLGDTDVHYATMGEISRQANVPTLFIEKMKLKGDIYESGEGRWGVTLRDVPGTGPEKGPGEGG